MFDESEDLHFLFAFIYKANTFFRKIRLQFTEMLEVFFIHPLRWTVFKWNRQGLICCLGTQTQRLCLPPKLQTQHTHSGTYTCILLYIHYQHFGISFKVAVESHCHSDECICAFVLLSHFGTLHFKEVSTQKLGMSGNKIHKNRKDQRTQHQRIFLVSLLS